MPARAALPPDSVIALREMARQGDLRGAADAIRHRLETSGLTSRDRCDLQLLAAFCAIRQGLPEAAERALDAADEAANASRRKAVSLRVSAWRAELAYFQGKGFPSEGVLENLAHQLEQCGDLASAAFALRVLLAMLVARADYAQSSRIAPRAVRLARAGGDPYVLVQVLNVLGAMCFDRATSRLTQPHARAHLPLVEPEDALHVAVDAREALAYFEQARAIALKARYGYAAWYVAGNIERLEILLGHGAKALPAIRRRLATLQARGARYDEIVVRSNLAWALRTQGRFRTALHELDVALEVARETGTANVMLEFLHYDRSVVLHALGDHVSAHASYRQYRRLAGKALAREPLAPGAISPPLEPYFLKRADAFILPRLRGPIALSELAAHCCVSTRTLQTAFRSYRGLTAVAHIRNLRLDRAREALAASDRPVAKIASDFGFASATTFTREFRRRFGLPPSRGRQAR